jgi:hypothetical protein
MTASITVPAPFTALFAAYIAIGIFVGALTFATREPNMPGWISAGFSALMLVGWPVVVYFAARDALTGYDEYVNNRKATK